MSKVNLSTLLYKISQTVIHSELQSIFAYIRPDFRLQFVLLLNNAASLSTIKSNVPNVDTDGKVEQADDNAFRLLQ